MYMNADLTKKAREHYTSIPYIYNAKRAKLVRRLYIICRISYMIVAVACTFLIYSVFGWQQARIMLLTSQDQQEKELKVSIGNHAYLMN